MTDGASWSEDYIANRWSSSRLESTKELGAAAKTLLESTRAEQRVVVWTESGS